MPAGRLGTAEANALLAGRAAGACAGLAAARGPLAELAEVLLPDVLKLLTSA
jgi:hypothetical protein